MTRMARRLTFRKNYVTRPGISFTHLQENQDSLSFVLIKKLQRFMPLFPYFLLLRLGGGIPAPLQVLNFALQLSVARQAARVNRVADGAAGLGFVSAVPKPALRGKRRDDGRSHRAVSAPSARRFSVSRCRRLGRCSLGSGAWSDYRRTSTENKALAKGRRA